MLISQPLSPSVPRAPSRERSLRIQSERSRSHPSTPVRGEREEDRTCAWSQERLGNSRGEGRTLHFYWRITATVLADGIASKRRNYSGVARAYMRLSRDPRVLLEI